jgi:hypothetical protein
MVFPKNFIALALLVFGMAEASSSPLEEPHIASLFFPELPSSSYQDGSMKFQDIQLDGIVWQSARLWTVWINGEKITSQKPHPHYDIIAVTENWVQIRRPDGQPITLRPGRKHEGG